MSRCATCGVEAALRQFPAAFREEKETGRGVVAGGELSGEGGRCFSHPEVSAVAVCGGCGRFMCRICDTEWDGEHLCLSCIHDRREVKGEEGFVSRRIIYDNAALGLLAVPIVFWYPFLWVGIITGPMAMFYLLRYRRASRGFVPRGGFRAVLAWILAVTSILLGLGMIAFLVYAMVELSVTVPPAN